MNRKVVRINRVVKLLIASDFVIYASFGFVIPIFAIFITDHIKGGNLAVVGFAAAIYWILKSLLQIPFARLLDKYRGEKDDFYFLVIGSFIAALVPFGYLISQLPWHIYTLQVIYAVGMAMAYPAWCAIFTRHIDKGREAFEWGLDSTALGLGAGITGAVGGVLATYFGFNALFILMGILLLLGTVLLIFVRKNLYLK
jgi:MFS family permease